jgi:hypothetical protein
MRFRLLVLGGASWGVALVAAEQNSAASADGRTQSLPAVFVSQAPTTTAKSAGVAGAGASVRAVSPEMSARLLSVALRRAPASAMPAASDGVSGNSGDAVQLKPFVVHEERLPRFKARELMTPQAKLALARQRYPGIGSLGDAASLKRLEDDFNEEYFREMADLDKLFEIGGGKSPIGARQIINEARHAEPFHAQFGHLP